MILHEVDQISISILTDNYTDILLSDRIFGLDQETPNVSNPATLANFCVDATQRGDLEQIWKNS